MNIGRHLSTHTLDRIFNAAIHKTPLTVAAADYKNPLQKLIDYFSSWLGLAKKSDVKANTKADLARAIQHAANQVRIVPTRAGSLGYQESGSFSMKDNQGTTRYFKMRQINGNIDVIAFNPQQAHSDQVVYTAHRLTFEQIRQAGQSTYEELLF